jgi:ABC-type transporter lipoprotein component MlaA
VGIVDFRATNADFINNLKESSSDYYTTVKTIYIQKRNSDIKNATFNLDNERDSEQEAEFIHFDE